MVLACRQHTLPKNTVLCTCNELFMRLFSANGHLARVCSGCSIISGASRAVSWPCLRAMTGDAVQPSYGGFSPCYVRVNSLAIKFYGSRLKIGGGASNIHFNWYNKIIIHATKGSF